jgi:antitoxin ParD1/3/4
MAAEPLHITLPDSLRRFVDERVRDGAHGDAGDYVRELIQADWDQRKRQGEERLQALLLEGIESGDPTPMTREDWQTIRQEGRARLVSA